MITLGVVVVIVVYCNMLVNRMKLLKQKTFRIGLQQLWYCGECNQFYVSIENRIYQSIQPIPHLKAQIWFRMLGGGQLPKDVSLYGDAYMRANHVQDQVCPNVDNPEHDSYGDTNT